MYVMIYIPISEEKAHIQSWYKTDTPPTSLKENQVVVNEQPPMSFFDGEMNNIAYYNPSANAFFFEKEEYVPTKEETIEQQIANMQQDITNTQIGLTEVYELLLGGTL